MFPLLRHWPNRRIEPCQVYEVPWQRCLSSMWRQGAHHLIHVTMVRRSWSKPTQAEND